MNTALCEMSSLNAVLLLVDGSASMLSGNHSSLDNTDTSVGVSSIGVTSGQSANQYTGGSFTLWSKRTCFVSFIMYSETSLGCSSLYP